MTDGIKYLSDLSVPNMMNDAVASLLQHKPLNARTWTRDFLSTMDTSGFEAPERTVIYLIGGPASGKGTLAKLIYQDLGPKDCAIIGAGELLREEVAKGTEQGKMLDALMKEGKIVPGHITIGLLKQSIEKLPRSVKWVLIDGFPRSTEQALQFESLAGRPEFVLCFHCPDELMFKRMVDRGAAGSGRADDNEVTARKRIRTHHLSSIPVIEYYRAQGKLYDIDASNQAPITWPFVRPLFVSPSALPIPIFVMGSSSHACREALMTKFKGQYACQFLNATQVISDESKRDCEPSARLAADLAAGHRIEPATTYAIMKRALVNDVDPKVKFVLIEGFPSTIQDILYWESTYGPTKGTICFEVEDELTWDRQHQALVKYMSSKNTANVAHGVNETDGWKVIQKMIQSI